MSFTLFTSFDELADADVVGKGFRLCAILLINDKLVNLRIVGLCSRCCLRNALFDLVLMLLLDLLLFVQFTSFTITTSSFSFVKSIRDEELSY